MLLVSNIKNIISDLNLLSKIFDPFPKKTNLTFFKSSLVFGNKVLISSNSSVLENIIFNYDIDLLDENYVDICLSGLNLVNSDKEVSTNEIDLKNKEKGLFEKFFNLFG